MSEFVFVKSLSAQKHSTLVSVSALDRAALLLINAAESETNSEVTTNLECLVSDTTAYVSTVIALWFNVGKALTSRTFHLNTSFLHGLDIIFGYTETSQSLRYGVNIVKTDIYSQISWAELIYGLFCFVVIQRATVAGKHKSSLHVKWSSTIYDDGIYTKVDHTGLNQQYQTRITELSRVANSSREPVEYKLKITESIERKIDIAAADYSSQFTEQFTVLKHQFGTITPGDTLAAAVSHQSPCAVDEFTRLLAVCRYRRYQSASYGRSFLHYSGLASIVLGHHEHAAFAEYVGLSVENVVSSSYSSGYSLYRFSSSPLIYFITVDSDAKSLVVTLRGTFDLQDVLTDAMCQYSKFIYDGKEYKAHCGMLRSARLVLRSPLMDQLRDAMELYKDHSLTICGHSLGAGVAAVLALLLTEKHGDVFVTKQDGIALPAGRIVQCICYAPPATVSVELSDLIEGLVTSVIYSDDAVPHLSLGLLWDLKAITIELQKHHHKFRTILKYIFSDSPAGTDNYLDFFLEKLRQQMKSEKLVPPGLIYRIDSDLELQTPKYLARGLDKEALQMAEAFTYKFPRKVIVSQITNKCIYFNEPIFSEQMFYHTSNYYEKSLDNLATSLAQQQA